MHQSLLKHCPDFHLYVIAFDDVTFNYLIKFPQEKLTVISLSQFEDEKLLSIKSSRSAGEYCWTSTPSTVLYCINTFKLNHCVYIDADMCFYSNPQSLFDEWGNESVLITEHRYTPQYDQSILSGTYCVQFVGFKNDVNGIEALTYWRNACIDWCYARAENGKFGDQKYLDDWSTRFKHVHVLKHLGGGIAPWNIQQYNFNNDGGKLLGTEISTGIKFEVVFCHFHGLKFYEDDIVSLTDSGYALSSKIINLIYKPYVRALMIQKNEIFINDSSINSNGAVGKALYTELNFKQLMKFYLHGIKSSRRNVFGKYLIKMVKKHYFFKSTKF